MINRRYPDGGEPHSEPEIIPPGHTDIRELESRLRGRLPMESTSFQRVFISRIGPFGLLPVFMLSGVIAVAMAIFVLGAFLILIPALGFAIAATLFTVLLRGRPR
ncbi:MAG TPA: hypothetical protein VL996_14440 [Methylocella sp.]|nr:hypothetical protein [Methylocella sp.]